jgi:hypothetical protein
MSAITASRIQLSFIDVPFGQDAKPFTAYAGVRPVRSTGATGETPVVQERAATPGTLQTFARS